MFLLQYRQFTFPIYIIDIACKGCSDEAFRRDVSVARRDGVKANEEYCGQKPEESISRKNIVEFVYSNDIGYKLELAILKNYYYLLHHDQSLFPNPVRYDSDYDHHLSTRYGVLQTQNMNPEILRHKNPKFIEELRKLKDLELEYLNANAKTERHLIEQFNRTKTILDTMQVQILSFYLLSYDEQSKRYLLYYEEQSREELKRKSGAVGALSYPGSRRARTAGTAAGTIERGGGKLENNTLINIKRYIKERQVAFHPTLRIRKGALVELNDNIVEYALHKVVKGRLSSTSTIQSKMKKLLVENVMESIEKKYEKLIKTEKMEEKLLNKEEQYVHKKINSHLRKINIVLLEKYKRNSMVLLTVMVEKLVDVACKRAGSDLKKRSTNKKNKVMTIESSNVENIKPELFKNREKVLKKNK